ncbi:meiotic nuclear division protein 1 homolog [Branchiostoma lanceolatum]|uniref:meiotic nuclear division protein 1 homolog n=1 Tax=Branchiostoma lanceolatum TaxID=7740 RepID=UPI00345462BC
MSKRKGISLEEKRQRMLSVFYDRKEFFQLKELEKIGSKEKGINAMVIKDVIQGLVDDGLVDTERIGTSNYFWAFPSKAVHTRKRKITDLETQLGEGEKKRKTADESISKAKVGREDSESREKILKELKEKKTQCEKLAVQIEHYKECDPEVLEAKQQETQVAKDAANRWTDNVFSIKSWCKRKFGFEESVLDKQFGIPEDFDYID